MKQSVPRIRNVMMYAFASPTKSSGMKQVKANHCFKARIRPSMIGFDVVEGQAKLDQFVDYVMLIVA